MSKRRNQRATPVAQDSQSQSEAPSLESILGSAQGEDTITKPESDISNTEESTGEDSISDESSETSAETNDAPQGESGVDNTSSEEQQEEKPEDADLTPEAALIDPATARFIEMTNIMGEREAHAAKVLGEAEERRQDAESIARFRAEALMGGPLPVFDLEKANAPIELTPEPEPEPEVAEEVPYQPWIGFAQRVLDYEGEDSVEAWQLVCRKTEGLMPFYHYQPTVALLTANQVQYLENAELDFEGEIFIPEPVEN